MKIIITSPVKYKDKRHEIGAGLDVPEEVAKGLFAAQSAKRAGEPEEDQPDKEKAKGKK